MLGETMAPATPDSLRLLDIVESFDSAGESADANVFTTQLSTGHGDSAGLLAVNPAEIDPCCVRDGIISAFHSFSSTAGENRNTRIQSGLDFVNQNTPLPVEGNTPTDSLNTNNTVGMLSPPSSTDGEFDNIGCDELFPELLGAGTQPLVSEADPPIVAPVTKKIFSVKMSSSDFMKYVSKQNVLKVDTCPVKQEPYDIDPVRIGRPPKYQVSEPEDGFAISGPNSKNAVLARENRRKKKEYVTSLEKNVSELTAENASLRAELSASGDTVSELTEEIEYLKSVIANHTTLGALLQNIPNAEGVVLKRSRALPKVSPKRARGDHDYLTTKEQSRPGICLHVSDEVVSLEFCKTCSRKAQPREGD